MLAEGDRQTDRQAGRQRQTGWLKETDRMRETSWTERQTSWLKETDRQKVRQKTESGKHTTDTGRQTDRVKRQ